MISGPTWGGNLVFPAQLLTFFLVPGDERGEHRVLFRIAKGGKDSLLGKLAKPHDGVTNSSLGVRHRDSP